MSLNFLGGESHEIEVPGKDVCLRGDLFVPQDPQGLVIFAHGSGSSRHSPRNQSVARFLNRQGLGTFLVDLLSPEEESVDCFTGHLRFDLLLLAQRLIAATDWIEAQDQWGGIGRGYFGSSTGGGAALIAAARGGERIQAVVSRGGRPDLAAEFLADVEAPTLLIVGGRDPHVLELNRQAARQMTCEHDLAIVPDSGHLFEEAGALEKVAQLSARWFLAHLPLEIRK